MLCVANFYAIHMDLVSFLRVEDQEIAGCVKWRRGIVLAQTYIMLCVYKLCVGLRSISRDSIQAVVLYWFGVVAFSRFYRFRA